MQDGFGDAVAAGCVLDDFYDCLVDDHIAYADVTGVRMESSQKIATHIGAKNLSELTFPLGKSEANNLALMGAAAANQGKGKKLS